jgi:hypothetical protein
MQHDFVYIGGFWWKNTQQQDGSFRQQGSIRWAEILFRPESVPERSEDGQKRQQAVF